MIDYLVPILLLLACAVALGKKENTYSLLLDGAETGLKLLIRLIPITSSSISRCMAAKS